MTESIRERERLSEAAGDGAEQATKGADSGGPAPARGLLGSLHATIKEKLSAGDRAELRRHPATSLAFQKLHAACFPHVRRPKTEERWQVLVQTIAILVELYDPKTSLGTALAKAKLSEGRLTRLLRADASALPRQIHACARILAAKAERQNMNDFARLLGIGVARDNEEAIRRRIAADYYRAIAERQRATPIQ